MRNEYRKMREFKRKVQFAARIFWYCYIGIIVYILFNVVQCTMQPVAAQEFRAGTTICDTAGRNCSRYVPGEGAEAGQLETSRELQGPPRSRFGYGDDRPAMGQGGLQRGSDGFYSAPNYGGLR